LSADAIVTIFGSEPTETHLRLSHQFVTNCFLADNRAFPRVDVVADVRRHALEHPRDRVAELLAIERRDERPDRGFFPLSHGAPPTRSIKNAALGYNFTPPSVMPPDRQRGFAWR
jgi:hypothetical protein